MIAATSWPEAAVAMAGVFLVLAVAVALIVSIASTVRARMSVQRELAYRKLAEDSAAAQHRTADQLERAIAELSELRTRTGELERLIKAVE
jgi:flagellar biosynthesis/type III secretory pathway M-ring protein FliF/YscJ